MAKCTPPTQDTPYPPQDSPVPRQDSELSRACPWCGQSIEGLAPDGCCHQCGKAYEAWMLGPVPRTVVPRWFWLAPALFWIICFTGLFVYDLAFDGPWHSTSGAFLTLIGAALLTLFLMAPSLILLYIAIFAFCAARHPRGASVVACCGLVGAALGGPGIVVPNVIKHGFLYIDSIGIPFVVQPVATFAALVWGSLIAVFIPRDKTRAYKSTFMVTPRQRRAWIAHRLASEKAALLRKTSDRSHPNKGTPGPKPEPDNYYPH